MNTTGKWLARAGGILIILGFVLPVMTVSCTGLPSLGYSFSLIDLIGQANQPMLFLVPLGALVAIVLSVLPSSNPTTMLYFYWGQVAGFFAGVLSLLITLVSLNTQVNNLVAFDLTPEFGLFVLIGGYLIAVIGLVVQWQELHKYPAAVKAPLNSPSPPFIHPPPISQAVGSGTSGPRLQAIRGNSPQPIIPIETDNFLIGRGSDNDLQLHDIKVSRQHACLRFAQGSWYVQDRESTGGILVNDQPIQATRLASGDKITIGDETFIFYE